jgi:pimeloyl-ACP methyl ester carboxylesterase
VPGGGRLSPRGAPPNPRRIGAGRHVAATPIPDKAVVSVHKLGTSDGAETTGVLYDVPGATAVVTLMHPRTDVTHHAAIPFLLAGGYAVWAQGGRNVGSDLTLIHEEAIIDVAAGLAFLRERGYDHVVALGHSGGGALYAYYIAQASRPAPARIATTPAGRPSGLSDCTMDVPDGVVLLAPHPGQGELLLSCIDPSVTDEADPLSVDPELDLYTPANGFAEPPASSSYSPEFLERFRAAQRARVERIDERARALVAERDAAKGQFKATGAIAERRRGIAPRLITVYRTDADPRTVDLSLDPSDRPYGSVFGRRPDLTNYGLIGFGRLTTPDAWLSTWSGLSSNAAFSRCGAEVTVPSLVIEFTGDQIGFPGVIRRIFDSLGGADKTHLAVPGTHFGGPIAPGEATGAALASAAVLAWLAERFPVA